jgi:hypothetical protein
MAATAATINPNFFMMSPLFQLDGKRTSNVRQCSDGIAENSERMFRKLFPQRGVEATAGLTRYSMIA